MFTTGHFKPTGVYLGPFLQTLVFLVFASLFSAFLHQESLLLDSEVELVTYSLSMLLGLVGLSVLTGFFHDDGLADTADGFGPSAFSKEDDRIPAIRKAMKDSRVGAYGASVLILFWLLRYVGAFELDIHIFDWALIIFTSRATGLSAVSLLLFLDKKSSSKEPVEGSSASASQQKSKGLANHTLNQVTDSQKVKWLVAYLFVLLASGLFLADFSWIVKLILMVILNSLFFRAIFKRNGQICGDTIGASICVTECILIVTL